MTGGKTANSAAYAAYRDSGEPIAIRKLAACRELAITPVEADAPLPISGRSIGADAFPAFPFASVFLDHVAERVAALDRQAARKREYERKRASEPKTRYFIHWP